MRYDMRQIMKDAWELKKRTEKVFSECLKMAWTLAKSLVEIRKKDRNENTGVIRVNFWCKYNKFRAYIERSWDSKYQNSLGYYIDLENGRLRL